MEISDIIEHMVLLGRKSLKRCFNLRGRDGGVVKADLKTNGKRKVQGVPQSQTAALPRLQEEEETDKTKQAQIEQT